MAKAVMLLILHKYISELCIYIFETKTAIYKQLSDFKIAFEQNKLKNQQLIFI